MNVVINYGRDENELSQFPLSELALFVLNYQKLPDTVELVVSFVDSDEIASLNKHYRQKDAPTDVLSFICDELEDYLQEDPNMEQTFAIGDVIIATEIAKKQTKEYGTTLEEELSILMIHGILHLCGYDHIEDDEAEIMEALEDKILEQWLKSSLKN